MTTITNTAFTHALSLARAHGHLWASHVDHPAVASIVSGPGPYDAAALAEAFDWAIEDEDGLGFSLSHTTASGRLSWSVCAAGVSQGPYDTAPAAGDVDLTVSRPSLAWRVWSAQRQAAQVASEDDSRVGAELTRMLPPEPERGSMDVLRVRIPASPLGVPRWLAEPEVQDIGYRHLHTQCDVHRNLHFFYHPAFTPDPHGNMCAANLVIGCPLRQGPCERSARTFNAARGAFDSHYRLISSFLPRGANFFRYPLSDEAALDDATGMSHTH